jgi:hypothetical protein
VKYRRKYTENQDFIFVIQVNLMIAICERMVRLLLYFVNSLSCTLLCTILYVGALLKISSLFVNSHFTYVTFVLVHVPWPITFKGVATELILEPGAPRFQD